VKLTIRLIARALFRAGGPGIFVLSAFDSSPLVVPLGNDLLVLALSARFHQRMPYYVLMATLGSLLGCLVTVWVGGKSEGALKKMMSGRYLRAVQDLADHRAGLSLVLASLLPPPFPFTLVVGAVAAFRYPKKKLFAFVAVGRLTRFLIEGALAIHYGRWIIRQAESPLLYDTMIALIVISIAGSIFSIYQRHGKSKRLESQARQAA
jgi:membrane protein YqaA with SNARE-associated domain